MEAFRFYTYLMSKEINYVPISTYCNTIWWRDLAFKVHDGDIVFIDHNLKPLWYLNLAC